MSLGSDFASPFNTVPPVGPDTFIPWGGTSSVEYQVVPCGLMRAPMLVVRR